MANATGSTYPHPPFFYKLCSGKTETGEAILPPLPPPPVKGEYTLYGTTHSAVTHLPPLPGQKLVSERLDGSADIKSEMRRLNSELAIALDQLMDTLENAPADYARSLEMVVAILNNMMHLSNLLRPIQARATLRHMLTERVEEKRALLQQLREDTKALDRLHDDVIGAVARATLPA